MVKSRFTLENTVKNAEDRIVFSYATIFFFFGIFYYGVYNEIQSANHYQVIAMRHTRVTISCLLKQHPRTMKYFTYNVFGYSNVFRISLSFSLAHTRVIFSDFHPSTVTPPPPHARGADACIFF